MKVKGIVAEDFCNYKVPSMFIISSVCDWKCCIEAGLDISVCQNASLISQPVYKIDDGAIYEFYRRNPITQAVVIGGLEPMLQFDEVLHLLNFFRSSYCKDPFVIYTGYLPEEIPEKIEQLRGRNVIVKFGRFIPNSKSRHDELLGVTLASENQFAQFV